MITDVFRSFVRSYKQLPLNLYHIQWKFRDEIRPRFGVMRGREFLMKDAYSFDLTADAARQSYYRMYCAYLNTFSRMGLKAVPMRADTGPIGGDLSHEFIILAETGESAVFCDSALVDMEPPGSDLDFLADLKPEFDKRAGYYAATEDMHDQARFEAETPEGRRLSARGIEVGHIFYFGSKYSKPMNAMITGPDGRDVPAEMGSYGIGVSRLVGAIIEACHDDKGVVWPAAVAPFSTAVVSLRADDAQVSAVCEDAYGKLLRAGVDVMYDDTADRPGAKLSTLELIGVPQALVVGPKGVKAGIVEFKDRKSGATEELTLEAAVNKCVAAAKAG
jgi:prolyl-tRNA synthetase